MKSLIAGLAAAGLMAVSAQAQSVATGHNRDCDDVPFTVFFPWDGADLTIHARQVMFAAMAQLSGCEVTGISVRGYADRSGDATYNDGLSRKRADAVVAALQSEGYAQDLISVAAAGEREQALASDDGLREARNRRVDVVFTVRAAS